MCDALDGGVDDVAAVDRALDNLEPRLGLQQPVVAQRSDPDPRELFIARGEHPSDEGPADLAGRARDQDQRLRLHASERLSGYVRMTVLYQPTQRLVERLQ